MEPRLDEGDEGESDEYGCLHAAADAPDQTSFCVHEDGIPEGDDVDDAHDYSYEASRKAGN